MILVCPSCDTRYFAEDSAIGKEGRRVRCASCGHSWHAKVQDEGAAPPAEDTGLTREQVERLRQTAAANSASRNGPHAEYRAREHKRRQEARLRATGVAWAIGFAVFASGAGAAVLFRNDVADAWPRSASLYRAVGLDVNRFGLVLEDVTAKRSFDGTTPVLTVTGAAVNSGKAPREAPLLKVTLRDETGEEVQTWSESIGVASVAGGETARFALRLEAPPVETYRLTVTFAREEGADSAAAGEVEAATDSGEAVDHDGSGHDGSGHEAGAPEGEALHDAGAQQSANDHPEPPWSGGDGIEGEAPTQEGEHAAQAAPTSAAVPSVGEADHH